MKGKLTHAQGRAFVNRWQLVNEFEKEELRKSTPAEKLSQLAALMASVEAMGWGKALASEDEEVWRRWQILRMKYGKKNMLKKKKNPRRKKRQ